MASQNLVNIGSSNDLVPDGTKPLPEPVLTNQQRGLVTFIDMSLQITNIILQLHLTGANELINRFIHCTAQT